MTIGESLKRARKKMGLELDDVVRSTKIAKIFLIALENDDISSLPQGVYTRNFLRTYARFLNLDEDILTAEFHDQYSIKPQFVHQKEQTKLDNINFVRQRNRRVLALVLLVIIPSILFWIYWQNQAKFNLLFSELTGETIGTKTAPATDRPPAKINKVSDPLGSSPRKNPEGVVPATIPHNEPSPATTPEDVPLPDEPLEDLNGNGPQGEPPAEQADLTKTDSEEPEPVKVDLPLTDTAGIVVFPRGNEAVALSDTFVIAAKSEPIWLYVEIDGAVITNRRLSPGEMRCYRYGVKQTVNIGDVYQVAVQSGENYRERASEQRVYVKIIDFGPGRFFEALDEAVAIGLEEAKKAREDEE